MPKLGYLLPTRERVMENHHETGSLLALAERAEALGFDSIWVGDSVTARPRHDPLTLLAAVAARTKKAELGTAVLLPALRNPVLLAHQVATVDRISEGRLILGIGIAADMPAIRREFEAMGVPFEKRVGRMNEAMRLCKALWSGKPVTWPRPGSEGRWTMTDAVLGPTPHRPGGPPIWFGGGLPAGRERTGRLYDGWFPNLPTPEEFPAQIAEVRTPGTALDMGMGQGRNSIWLARQGWKVTGFDPAVQAMAVAQQNAASLGLTLTTVEARDDTFDWGDNKWDLILLSYAGCDPANVPRIEKALKPGGVLGIEEHRLPVVTGTTADSVFVAQTPEELEGALAHINSRAMSLLKRKRALRLCRENLAWSPTLFQL